MRVRDDQYVSDRIHVEPREITGEITKRVELYYKFVMKEKGVERKKKKEKKGLTVKTKE
jgi:hypothetical protein